MVYYFLKQLKELANLIFIQIMQIHLNHLKRVNDFLKRKKERTGQIKP